MLWRSFLLETGEPVYPDKPIRIMAFDPGSSTTGVAIGDISIRPYHVKVTHTATLNLVKSTKHLFEMDEGTRYNRLHVLGVSVKELVLAWRPSFVVAESPYLRDHPSTYATLTECCLVIRRAVQECDLGIDFDLVDPSSAKNAVGANGRAKKEEVRAKVKEGLTHLTLDFPLGKMSEHAVDATAVLYARFRQLTGL